MGLFPSLTQEIAIDLGTANTVITSNGRIVVDQPSIIAIDTRTEKLVAIGDTARKMHERTHDRIKTIRPLKDGVIADFRAAELMIRGMIRMIPNRSSIFRSTLRMVIGIPSGSTEVEIRAVKDSAEQAGGREIFLLFEPMAAALGIGLDIEAPEGNMVVDIGGGTTEIAVLSLGGLVTDRSLKIAGDEFTADIMEYMSRQYNMKVGDANINVDMIIQNIGVDGKNDFTFTVPRGDYDTTVEILRKNFPPESGVVIHGSNIAKVSIVGVGMRSHAAVASTMFQALAKEGINIHIISTSEIKISVGIDEKYLELAVRALHEAFGLEKA